MRPEARLFTHGHELGAGEEAAAQTLAGLGLVTLRARTLVHCVNEADHDYVDLRSKGCLGRVLLRDGADENDGAYRCLECDREILPSRKARSTSVKVSPSRAGIVAWLGAEMAAVGLAPREQPVGVLRAATDCGEVQVCVVDFCADPGALDPVHARRDETVFVVANPDYAAHVPAGATAFVLADLLLGETEACRRRLRELAHRSQDALPAVLTRRASATVAVVPAARAPAATTTAKFAMPIGTTWADVAFDWVDEESALRVRGPGLPHPVRCTQADLGWARAHDRWTTMKAVCLGRGLVGDWRALSERRVAKEDEMKRWDAFKRQIARLRDDLQALFGIAEDPFRFCSRREGLRARFEANECLPERRAWARLGVDEEDGDVRLGQPVSDPRSTTSIKGVAMRPERSTPAGTAPRRSE